VAQTLGNHIQAVRRKWADMRIEGLRINIYGNDKTAFSILVCIGSAETRVLRTFWVEVGRSI
jgi:hypothetical protein